MRSIGFGVLVMIELACGAAAEVPGEGAAGRFDPRTAFMAQPLVGRAPRGFATCSRGASLAPFVVRDGRANAASKSDLRMQASNKFEIEGTLINVMKLESFPSGFVKRAFIVRTDEMYPQEVKFELYKDKISLIDNYQVNDQVKVSFNIRGSQWEGKYFTNLQAWRIERAGGEGQQMAAQAQGLDLSEWDGYGSGNTQQQQLVAGMQAPQTRGQAPAGNMPANGPSNGRKAAVQWDDDIPF